MLEGILDKHVLFVLMGILTVLGIVSKCVATTSLKRMVRAAGNMGKTTHPLMRLVRAKFEHACMVSEKVENVRVFVDKYLYEYKIAGIKLHTWRRLEKISALLCLVLGIFGAAAWYAASGAQDMALKTGGIGAGLAVLLYLIHLSTDENYRLEAAGNYMVDYLQNVCLHRYEKAYQKEIKVMAPEAPVPDLGAAEVKEIPPYRDKEMPERRAVPEMEPEKKYQPQREMEPAREPKPEIQSDTVIPIAPATQAKKTEKAASQKERKNVEEAPTPKDVLIRQILEEFMA